ncbi:MAG: GNAT family N-acetyltransferase [Phormidesmis priestleyi]|uniref:GNAT family N-acetyltransferase n=1 Tax=Phormidesmis priestleyi TaxID=268141 RepID=A0A2W4XCH4_9CYAN|nr:MAG: GNAT family N-acetyltransferase [Phormidesmis priestleyi]
MSQANAEPALPPAAPPAVLAEQFAKGEALPTPFRVRSAQPKDLLAIVHVLLASFYTPILTIQPPAQWLYWLMRIGIQEDIKTRLKLPVSQYACLVATQVHPDSALAGAVIGTAEISQRPCERWQLFPPKRAYLSNLAIKPEYRRQGAAQQLLKTCDSIALGWGFHRIYLHVMADNLAAQALYAQAGYELYEVSNPVLSGLRIRPQRLLLMKQIDPSR